MGRSRWHDLAARIRNKRIRLGFSLRCWFLLMRNAVSLPVRAGWCDSRAETLSVRKNGVGLDLSQTHLKRGGVLCRAAFELWDDAFLGEEVIRKVVRALFFELFTIGVWSCQLEGPPLNFGPLCISVPSKLTALRVLPIPPT